RDGRGWRTYGHWPAVDAVPQLSGCTDCDQAHGGPSAHAATTDTGYVCRRGVGWDFGIRYIGNCRAVLRAGIPLWASILNVDVVVWPQGPTPENARNSAGFAGRFPMISEDLQRPHRPGRRTRATGFVFHLAALQLLPEFEALLIKPVAFAEERLFDGVGV